MPDRVLGLLAEFGMPRRRCSKPPSARKAEGFRRIDAFTPFPVEGMAEVLALKRDHRIGWITLGGGLFGFFGMLLVQLFVNWDYPIEVGNRPLFAWPAFFVVDFELMILCAVLFAVVGMFAINGAAQAASSVVRGAALRPRLRRSLFPVHRRARSKVRRKATRSFLGKLGAWTVDPVRP